MDALEPQNVVNKEILYTLKESAFCCICQNILWDPVECNKCENCLCKSCKNSWLIQSDTCPYKCQNSFFKPCRKIRALLSKLYFKCKCGEIIKYENLSTHSCKNISKNKKLSKFDKYDEVESECHEHILTIVKDFEMIKKYFEDNKKEEENENTIEMESVSESNIDFLKNNKDDKFANIKYFWTCDLCSKNFGYNIKSAFCSKCQFFICVDCINQNYRNNWINNISI